MRTLTAIALAITMLAGVTAANATTKHKKHHGKKHQASTSDSKSDKGSKEKAPATK